MLLLKRLWGDTPRSPLFIIPMLVLLFGIFFPVDWTPPISAQTRPVLSGWSIQHQPAAATQATITRAAVANQRHVADCITATLQGDTNLAAATTAVMNLRDGATGAGTILYSARLSLAAVAGGSSSPIQLCGLGVFGSTNTAMTLEFAAAGGANSFETVAIKGHDE